VRFCALQHVPRFGKPATDGNRSRLREEWGFGQTPPSDTAQLGY
jgi:hypothetical protein